MASHQQERREKTNRERDHGLDEQKVSKLPIQSEHLAAQTHPTNPPMVSEQVHIKIMEPTSSEGRMGKVSRNGGGGAGSCDDKEETTRSWQQKGIKTPAAAASDAGKSEGRSEEKGTAEEWSKKFEEERRKSTQQQGKTEERYSSYSVGKFEVIVKEVGDLQDRGRYNNNTMKNEAEGKKREGQTLEEIRRQTGEQQQQSSVDSIREAEERYSKAKEHAASAVHNTKETAVNLGSAAATYAAHLGVKAKDQTVEGVKSTTQFVAEKSEPVKEAAVDSALTGYTVVRDTTAEYAKWGKDTTVEYAKQAKDTTAEYAKRGKDYAGEKAVNVKEATKGAAGYVGEKAVGAKDVAMDTAVGAKDLLVDTAVGAKDVAVGAKDMTVNTVVGAKDLVVDTAVGAKDMTVNTVVGAKDVAVETGKKGVGMVERATGEAKVMGWGATEYVGEKATEAVKGVAGAVKGVGGYVGDTAVAAKDVAVDVTGKVGGYVEEKAVGVGETVKEYGERKKVEAERELQRKKEQDSSAEDATIAEVGMERSKGERITVIEHQHEKDISARKKKQTEVKSGIDYEI